MSYYKLKLACFEYDKTCKSILEKFAGLNPFITHTKPAKKHNSNFLGLQTETHDVSYAHLYAKDV